MNQIEQAFRDGFLDEMEQAIPAYNTADTIEQAFRDGFLDEMDGVSRAVDTNNPTEQAFRDGFLDEMGQALPAFEKSATKSSNTDDTLKTLLMLYGGKKAFDALNKSKSKSSYKGDPDYDEPLYKRADLLSSISDKVKGVFTNPEDLKAKYTSKLQKKIDPHKKSLQTDKAYTDFKTWQQGAAGVGKTLKDYHGKDKVLAAGKKYRGAASGVRKGLESDPDVGKDIREGSKNRALYLAGGLYGYHHLKKKKEEEENRRYR